MGRNKAIPFVLTAAEVFAMPSGETPMADLPPEVRVVYQLDGPGKFVNVAQASNTSLPMPPPMPTVGRPW